MACRIDQLRENRQCLIFIRQIPDMSRKMCPRLVFRYFGKRHKLTSTGNNIFLQRVGDIYFIRNHHPNIPVNPTIIIEVHLVLRLSRRCQRVRFGRNPDSQHIIAVPIDTVRKVCDKSHITAMMLRQFLTVQINIAIRHHSFKRDDDPFILIFCRQFEITAIPTDTVINGVSAAMLRFQLHDMRQGNRHPSGIIQLRPAPLFHFSSIESPVGIHIQDFPSGRCSSITAISQYDTNGQQDKRKYSIILHAISVFFNTKERDILEILQYTPLKT